MARHVNRGKTEQIFMFIQEFCASHGFCPTIREIADGVGLQSKSTVSNYLSRMSRAGLITSTPGTARSIKVVTTKIPPADDKESGSVLYCHFNFPEGTYPTSVVAMVADGDEKKILPVHADCIEVICPDKATKVRCD